MIDLNDVIVFARVVEAGSFTAAARLLAMPKTSVSRRVAALEREVGVRLLQRTTRSLNLTDAGRLYYEQSSQGLRTIEEANLRLAEARAEPSGTIRISAPVGFGGYFLIRAVVDFLALYPKTNVELRLTDDKLNLVEDGIDLAFRTGTLQDSTLIARKLGAARRLLCASPDYLARYGMPEGPADLARHRCVIAGPSASGAHWVLDGPQGQETVVVTGRFAANEMQAVLAAALAGFGVAQLPQAMAEGLIDQGRLQRVLEDYTTPAGGLHVLYPSSRHLSPLVKAFIELAAERISNRANTA
ncbi:MULTISPECIES: LysR family transcriptional regulator [unclassified Mesorhizobium]|uniref:LysR family transcriptional regulator n=1 Tax=unclassified Mesorhizobium TaxID=325217 RepID=UPI000FD21C34|nr:MULTISPECIES: LysR family transcriptional regulator [unclassified Mesorhizobium]RUW91420.1 LysR family transcriptional regulator [Mesorhizobium sp. M8A.F.Ca.ET.023.01.1.1]RUX10267.1 LysR family transcriptional regulator [Mesorhizobium sp. M8A.F.Ca.ET.059.01.1.1]RWC72232.1 MAG: LysR family transcriptional regulator [Mesorhizobium sp.]TGR58870.1 LysR family transcriptional regulator [bacterium M00.F.Ca.ET.199.01.1.1]TGU41021.1 LysR family transcriptional regulator [bacterium M00.F.Ca.ET.156.0